LIRINPDLQNNVWTAQAVRSSSQILAAGN
jgi:hypothetical protein